ncbi:hypothetical protein [Mogibacterium kristiansenii]|nr:hypothetical protein [Mogibacterium kristiansenii]
MPIFSVIPSAAGNRPFHLLGGKQLMQEHYFSAFLHQFPDFYRRPGLKPGRIQMKRDARKAPAGLRASLYNIVFSKRKELTTNARYLPFRRQF